LLELIGQVLLKPGEFKFQGDLSLSKELTTFKYIDSGCVFSFYLYLDKTLNPTKQQ